MRVTVTGIQARLILMGFAENTLRVRGGQPAKNLRDATRIERGMKAKVLNGI
jgi:hypothetical protein